MKTFVTIFITSLISSNLALAQEPVESVGDVVAILYRLANWMYILLLIFAFIAILIAAYNYLSSGGDQEKVKTAHRMLLYAVAAMAVGFLAKGAVALTSILITGEPI